MRDGTKGRESWGEYLAGQLLTLEGVLQDDRALGSAARRAISSLRRNVENERDAAEQESAAPLQLPAEETVRGHAPALPPAPSAPPPDWGWAPPDDDSPPKDET